MDPTSEWTQLTPFGRYRRKVAIRANERQCVAAVEDDAHRFEVSLAHDRAQVVTVEASAIRYPYTICPGAVPAVQSFVGIPISRDVTAPARALRAGLCCTHQFDLIALAIAQCARGIGQRVYDAEVRVDGETKVAALLRDAQPVLEWAIRGDCIESADAAHGLSVRSILKTLHGKVEEDFLEAIFVMRRALLVSPGRTRPPDMHVDPIHLMDRLAGACHSFQPARVAHGRLVRTHFRDFENAPELMLGAWLKRNGIR